MNDDKSFNAAGINVNPTPNQNVNPVNEFVQTNSTPNQNVNPANEFVQTNPTPSQNTNPVNEFVQTNTFTNTKNENQNVQKETKQKKEINLKLIVLILIAIVASYFIFIFVKNTFFQNEDVVELNNFLISNGEMSALFSPEGEQLTDFIYTENYSSDVYKNGNLLVERDGVNVLLNKEGVEIFVQHESSYLSSYDFLLKYTTIGEEDPMQSGLYSTDGKLIYSDNYEIFKFNSFVSYYYGDEYIIITDESDIIVLNSKYTEILTLPQPEDTFSASESGDFLHLKVDGHYYMIDLIKEKIVFESDDDESYKVYVDSYDNTLLTYGDITKLYDSNYNEIKYDSNCLEISYDDGIFYCKEDSSSEKNYFNENFQLMNFDYDELEAMYSYNHYIYEKENIYYIYKDDKTIEMDVTGSFDLVGTNYIKVEVSGEDIINVYNNDGTFVTSIIDEQISSFNYSNGYFYTGYCGSYSSECIYKLFSLDGEELVYTFDSLTPTTNNLIIAYIKNT
ncbi:MAG: hypothetical protein R3Y21_01035, partial [Mycoplasmatota bacterium]